MKHLILVFIIATVTRLCATPPHDQFQLIIKPAWHDLDTNEQQCQTLGKWVVVGIITFKKKSKEPVELNQLLLHWSGDHLDNLVASLYTKNPGDDFMPIEDNWVCDGNWNKKNQTLLFKLINQQSLGFINTFYLVLTIPLNLETKLKRGHFIIDAERLPEQFQFCSEKGDLCLHLNGQGAR